MELLSKRTVAWLAFLAATVACSVTGWAAEPVATPDDRELATVVVGKDGAAEVEQKLGSSPCLVASASGERMSYLYNVQGQDGRYFLRLEVNGLVDAITVSQDPPIAGVCYAPIRTAIPLSTAKGLRLGATQDEVVQLYGKPAESFSVGPMSRFRYVSMLDRSYEWDLVFRDGRLIEWTVAAED